MGNPTTYKGQTFTWGQGRKLMSGTMNGKNFTYNYDGHGMRYKKVVNGVSTEYYYNGTQLLMENRNGERIFYIYGVTGVEGLIRVIDSYKIEYYYFDKNTLGDVVAIRDQDGEVVAQYEYDAWGNITYQSGSMAIVNPFRYRGYYYDTETGFYYLQTRYYDPEICRFINADDYELIAELSEVLGQLNLYAYCGNNPVMYTDPSGCMPNWLKWVIGGVVIVGLGVLTVATAGGFAAAGTAIASVFTATMAPSALSAVCAGAFVGAVAVGGAGLIVGGMSGENGWSWENASNGFMFGTISGAIIGGIWGGAHYGLQLSGKMAVKTKITNLVNNPLDEFTTLGPKSGAIGNYMSSISQSGSYGKIYASKLSNGMYQIADGHHRVQALRKLGYSFVKFFIVR